MTSNDTTPLEQLSNQELIERIETGSLFECHAQEAELNARLECTGQRWRFNVQGKIELYYRQKLRPAQRPMDIGLFDSGARRQLDIADFLNRRE